MTREKERRDIEKKEKARKKREKRRREKKRNFPHFFSGSESGLLRRASYSFFVRKRLWGISSLLSS